MPSRSVYIGTWDVDRANAVVRQQFARCLKLTAFIELVANRKQLTKAQRLRLVDQALLLLEMNYVHLPLKRALHAIDPIRRLQLLRIQIEQSTRAAMPTEMQFHSEMQSIFTSTRDLHTNYLLPSPFDDKVAFLPFLIEEYFEEGEPKYLVSRVADVFRDRYFKPGVELLYWNGMPIRRAIELNGENQAGSNPAARFARGLDRMTIRPLMTSLPPDEMWVVTSFRTKTGRVIDLRHEWRVLTADPEGRILLFSGKARRRRRSRTRIGRAVKASADIQKRAINKARKILFAPEAVAAERRATTSNERVAINNRIKRTSMPGVFRARAISQGGLNFGYVRIFTFAADDADEFVAEFIRLLSKLPRDGLIIDVRGNEGGNINAGERMLQLLTPHRIQPEFFEFINTPVNLQLSRRRSEDADMSFWSDSIAQGLKIGAIYSTGVPLTTEESCNAIGQVYHGPVVLIIDALGYSTTDIFAAGFQDHQIGTILGTNSNTGAAGANVWEHDELRALAGGRGNLRRLPRDAGMRVALLRSIRVGKNAGQPLEELGVTPDQEHQLTRDDILHGNRDLIGRAATILSGAPVRELTATLSSPASDGSRTLTATTRRIYRLEAHSGNQQFDSTDGLAACDTTQFRVAASKLAAGKLSLQGYDRRGRLIAMRRITLPD